MDSFYKLRDCIDAHEKDVKSVFVFSNGYGLISASRDLSVRLWKEECEIFKPEKKFIFHKKYISVVIYMNPCLRYADGIILSAGYDKIVHGYSPLSGELEFSLEGHTDTVTSLSVTGMELVSGSMDRTAIIWDLNTHSATKILKGHSHGIWSVVLLQCIEHGLLTASADKTIFLWDTKSQTQTRQFIGHTDCVRNIMEIPEEKQFLSCGNDALIRLWSLMSSVCLKEFQGHSAYIYSMSMLPEGDSFVSCGEDGLVCVWNMDQCTKPVQTIVHTTSSVWCVSVLNNGDIITGASDGRIRLFSKHKHLQKGVELAPIKSNEAFKDEVINGLPSVGIEVLSLPGEYDGQLVKVADEGIHVLYGWSVDKDTWIKQQVLDNKRKTPEKKSHDHVFSIDIKDGEPPLKLGYNNGEDPWTVAHKFLEDNDVSPMFLDQVANFIIKNTNQTPVPVVSSQKAFSDPFTGGNRYVPDMTTTAAPVVAAAANMFPQKTYLRFDQINAAGLTKKMVEIAGANIISGDILVLLENLATIDSTDNMKLYRWIVARISEWDTDMLFPLIDTLRMLVRDPLTNDVFFSDRNLLAKLLSRTLGGPGPCSKGNMLTMVKLLVNGFCAAAGRTTMIGVFSEVKDLMVRCLASGATEDKATMMAASSWLLNMAVLVNDRHDDSRRMELIEASFVVLDKTSGTGSGSGTTLAMDALHRVLVTVGTLVCNSDSFTFRDNLTVGIFDKVNNVAKLHQNSAGQYSSDVALCSDQLARLVSSLDLFTY